MYHDDRAAMRGAVIEATFEPVWIEFAPWAPSKGVKRPAPAAIEVRRPPLPVDRPVPHEERRRVVRFADGGGLGAELAATSAAHHAPVDVHMTDSLQGSSSAQEADPVTKLTAEKPEPAKKQRRALGLAMSLGKEPPVVVQSAGKTD